MASRRQSDFVPRTEGTRTNALLAFLGMQPHMNCFRRRQQLQRFAPVDASSSLEKVYVPPHNHIPGTDKKGARIGHTR